MKSVMKINLVFQKGVGLIELMISVTLGLFLISGAVGIFISSKSTLQLNTELAWIQDNARFAMMTLTRDLRMAGFYGCSTDQGFTSTINPVASGTGWYMDFDNAVVGWDGDDGGYPGTEFPPAYNSNAATGLPNSDLTTVRHAESQSVEVDDNIPTNNANIRVHGSHPFEDGDVLVITDCDQTTVFQVTGMAGSQVIVHNTGGGHTPGNCSVLMGGASCPGAPSSHAFYGENGAFILQMKSNAYYVDASSDGTPALYRRELYASAGEPDVRDQELVQGVENLQVVYGQDTDNDGFANRYVNADDIAAADWPQVVTIRVHVLFRSFAEVASAPQDFRFVGVNYTPTDNFLRQEFISTIELRNKG